MYNIIYLIYKIRCYKSSMSRNIILEVTSPSKREKDCCLLETSSREGLQRKKGLSTLPSATLTVTESLLNARLGFSSQRAINWGANRVE